MARAAAEGHRVVLITATDGAAGTTDANFAGNLAAHRHDELMAAAAILNTSAVHPLEYRDSGLTAGAEGGFVSIPLHEVRDRIVQIARAEGGDVLIGYDPSGGYGHPDHVRVHEATRAAWQQLGSSTRLFEATLPREPIATAVTAAARLRLTPAEFDPAEFARSWTPRDQITHRVDVREYARAKQASMRAHASQQVADAGLRTLGVLGSLPAPLFRALMGREYYVAVR